MNPALQFTLRTSISDIFDYIYMYITKNTLIVT